MKNLVKFFLVIAFVAIIGFAMVSCGEDNPFVKNQFEGTWTGLVDSVSYSLVMTENTWKLIISNLNSHYSGTYTYAGLEATLQGKAYAGELAIPVPDSDISGKATVAVNALTLSLGENIKFLPFTREK